MRKHLIIFRSVNKRIQLINADNDIVAVLLKEKAADRILSKLSNLLWSSTKIDIWS